MVLQTQIIDGGLGKKKAVIVTEFGQLVVAPLSYSETNYKLLNADDTAFNFLEAVPTKRFVITSIFIDAGKNVSPTTAATIVVYESTAVDSLTVSKTILQAELIKNTFRDFVGLNIITREGFFINAKTSDADVAISINGYFVPVRGD